MQLDRMFPAGGQRGTTVDLTLEGKFPNWPVHVWSACPDITWQCQAESGKLQAVIAEAAPLGPTWIRLYDASGASRVQVFLVDAAPHSSETEPNDQIAAATTVAALPNTLFGVLNKSADVDLFGVNLSADQWLVATLDAHKWLNSPADANLQITDSRGFVVAENIDHVGLDPYLEFRAPSAGLYFVRVFAFPATPNSTVAFSGGADWIYRLRLSDQPQPLESALDFANQVELAAERQLVPPDQHTRNEMALPISLPARVKGTIASPQTSDYLQFTARSGGHYQLRALARHFGSPLDPVITISDANGKTLTQQDDVAQNRDPLVSWKAPADGTYFIAIRDFHRKGGEGYVYLLNIEEQPPGFSASVSSDLISAQVGQETELAVSIARVLEFPQAIEVSIEGLPDSVLCPPVVSQPGSDSAAKVTQKLTASEPFQGPVRVLARAVDDPVDDPVDDTAKSQTATAPDNKPLWLSVR